MSITAVRGGAALGKELAGLEFTNHSRSACALSGFPRVQLLQNGAAVGPAATPAQVRADSVTLRPGASVQSRLDVASTCNAPVSDSVRITPPGMTRHVDRPIRLRACASSVTPAGPS